MRKAFLLFLFCIPLVLRGQEPSCDQEVEKKALHFYELAGEAIKKSDFKTAEINVRKALEVQEDYVDANLLLAHLALKKKSNAYIKAFQSVITTCPEKSPEAYYHLGLYMFDQRSYDTAAVYFEKYLSIFTPKDSTLKISQRLKELSLFRANAMSHPVPFDPVSVPGISTPADEYLGIVTPDNEMAFFTRRYNKEVRSTVSSQLVEEFTCSHFKNGEFDSGTPMPMPFNQNNNEGGPTVTIDNRSLYFTICRREFNEVNCDIWFSQNKNGRWSEITNLGDLVNDPHQWDSQPSISSDGKVLYFSSGRDGGFGGFDIYKCEKNENGKWGAPVNMGPLINTSGNEKSPFMHSDSRTLYFSSDGWPGMGGYDIFMSQMDDSSNFKNPLNIGYPINSESDDLGFFVSTDGKTGFFASNKLQGKGGYDIYSFYLYPEVRPQRVLFIKGQVKSGSDGRPVQGTVEFEDKNTRKKYSVEVDSASGTYVSALNFKHDYSMTVKGHDQVPVTHYFSTTDTSLSTFKKMDVTLEKIENGKSYVLNDVTFSTNSYTLNDTAKTVLNSFVDFLQEQPALHVSIEGHTDNVNDASSNQALSENRAKAVYAYLIENGIEESRLKYKGWGETKPVADNTSPQGRAKNRRTEFIILNK